MVSSFLADYWCSIFCAKILEMQSQKALVHVGASEIRCPYLIRYYDDTKFHYENNLTRKFYMQSQKLDLCAVLI